MPSSHHQFRRLELLDQCIGNTGRCWYFTDLLREINEKLQADGYPPTSIRSLRGDIELLINQYHAPIEKVRDGRKIYYRYSKRYSFSRRPLTTDEAHQLTEAIKVLGSFEGLPQFDWIRELTVKMEKEFGLKQPRRSSFIQFDANIDLRGRQYFTPLYNGISQRRVFQVSYHPYPPNDPIRLTFHPYFLKQYNNRWFVLGWNEEEDMLYNLALDRIAQDQGLVELDHPYRDPGELDFQDHFDQIVGVTVLEGKSARRVLLRFQTPGVYYVSTKPLHLSQKRPDWQEDGTALIEISVIPNYELIQQILFYGDQVEVLEPPELRERVAEMIRRMAGYYRD